VTGEAHARPGSTDAPINVVATAGHVDHGKSSLLHRLTGMDPDRLEEEKRRGLTIDLGFAWTTLASGREIGFVDVPGHERFVRTMLAGVGPVRLVLFVVAADEGWKTQSEEHLAILDVLGVDGGVVALTKRDLVDDARLAAAASEVRERLAGSALDRSAIVACSSRTGEGLDELVGALDAMVAAAPPPAENGRPRLFVDRVFTIAGAGTVVTGTLIGGRLAVGEEVEAVPSGVRARVRSLQTHKRRIDVARPVSRVAVNLAAVERTRLERGDVLARRGDWRPTTVVEAWIRPVRGLAHAVTTRGAFTFHAGASERGASIRLYGSSSMPTAGTFARIRLSAPMVLDVHDPFVVRESGRRETVAGGTVLDPAPARRPGADAVARLERRAGSSRGGLPALLVAERGAVSTDELASLTGLEAVPGIEPLGRWWVAPAVRDEVEGALARHLAAFHAANPAAEGIAGTDVLAIAARALRAARAPEDRELADALVDDFVRAGVLARGDRYVRLPSHSSAIADTDVERVVAEVAKGGPTPPTVAELRDGGFSRETIEAAVRTGALVRIAPDLVLSASFVARAVEAVREAGDAGITVSGIRQRLNTSRKYAVPLMEHLDRTGATRRAGDLRFARGR
jgi:selenocysteine-specific elongation factor